ncbi:hypothetical protein HDU84_004295 [Entophlyctis sp. JEL0112]|nr:hypothetical protein HDU84_004295 [Entophlyctis sp. JEL0112]
MEDDDLAQIRAKRMAELRGSAAPSGAAMGGLPAGLVPGKAPGAGSGENDTEKLARLVNARERLSRISIVKAEKARAVEDLLLRMAQSGQLRGKISENMLIDLLEQLNEQQGTKVETKIKINRRAHDSDSDEDLLAGL